MRRTLGRAELFPDGMKRRRVFVIAVHVAEQTVQFVESRAIEPSVFLDTVTRPCLELIEVPAGFGHADDRLVQVAAFGHCLQRRKNFLVSQISGGPEED
jgi:hypothetical protein